jgi:hypothetical protein
MRTKTWGGAGALTVSLGIAGLALVPSTTPAGPTRVAGVLGLAYEARFELRGSGSCSAQACHGSINRVGGSNVWRDEHTVWATKDKHAEAYNVLLTPRSQAIAAKLGKRDNKVIPASEDARCLACHVSPSAIVADANFVKGNPSILSDGVSCESCHGPAGGYLAAHTVVGWRNQPAETKAQLGMNDLSDLATRAGYCAGCHVGAPADPERGLLVRDVNHDLIAAGHPRLNFEFSAYHALQPKHWSEKDPRNRSADFDARAWSIGQLAVTRAAVNLLAHHRADANSGAPWPEFAEYGCFSCHFDLQPTSWRNPADSKLRDPEQPRGLPVWGSWYAPMLRDFARVSGDSAGSDGALKTLRQTMGQGVIPDRAAAARDAQAALSALDAWQGRLGSESLDSGRVRSLISEFRNGMGPEQGVYSWDHAALRYLAVSALDRALGKMEPGAADPALKAELAKWLKSLEYPRGFDSPRGFEPGAGR